MVFKPWNMNLLIIYLKTQQFSISCYSICCINTNRHQQTVVVGFPATEDAFMRAETPSGRLSGADRKGSTRFFFNYLIFSKCGWERLVFFQRRWGTYFSRSALGPVQRRPLLGFAEVRVVRVTAPQLFARVKGSKLKPDTEERKQIHVTSCLLGKMWAWPIKIWNRINPTLAMSFYCWWNSDVHVTLVGFTAVHVVSHDALWETLKTLICCLFWTHCRSAVGPEWRETAATSLFSLQVFFSSGKTLAHFTEDKWEDAQSWPAVLSDICFLHRTWTSDKRTRQSCFCPCSRLL